MKNKVTGNITPLLVPGENIIGAYKAMRDYVVFTEVISKDFERFGTNGRDNHTTVPAVIY